MLTGLCVLTYMSEELNQLHIHKEKEMCCVYVYMVATRGIGSCIVAVFKSNMLCLVCFGSCSGKSSKRHSRIRTITQNLCLEVSVIRFIMIWFNLVWLCFGSSDFDSASVWFGLLEFGLILVWTGRLPKHTQFSLCNA